MISEVIRFAKENGYYGAEFNCKWNGYDCYDPLFDDTDESRKVGMLQILDDNNGNIRMATPDEFFDILDSMPDEKRVTPGGRE